jgi:hypothetical protein
VNIGQEDKEESFGFVPKANKVYDRTFKCREDVRTPKVDFALAKSLTMKAGRGIGGRATKVL